MKKDSDVQKGKIVQRVKRYGQVSGAVAGLAAKVAGEKVLGLTIDREQHAADLMMRLGNLKGPLMKVGQILATIPEALPPEYAGVTKSAIQCAADGMAVCSPPDAGRTGP